MMMLVRLVLFASLLGCYLTNAQEEEDHAAAHLRLASSCPYGYKYDKSGYCVVQSCNDNYQCPEYSSRKSGRDCYNNFDDCRCDDGYYEDNDYCVPDVEEDDDEGGCDSDYECPMFWKGKDGLDCYYDIDDCECDYGYKYVSGYCVSKNCRFDYKCPSYSKRKSNRSCYDNFDDCTCNNGYYKKNNKCVKKY